MPRNPDIWLPGMDPRPVIAKCFSCGKEFREGEYPTAMRHMAHCSDEHYERRMAGTPQRKVPAIFGPGSKDQELEAFIGKHRDAVLKGKRVRL